MRPTFSIILFTVLSGAGYGLWILVALVLLASARSAGFDGPALRLWPGWIGSGLLTGFVLVSIGLLSSLAHLGKPLRAWRAFSQWRSSWLSREGVASVLTYLPVLAIALFHLGAFPPGLSVALPAVCAALILIGSLATICCTANIYACLKPVPAWHNRYVVAGYLLLGLHCGALLAWSLASLLADPLPGLALLPFGVIATALAGALVKFFYWRFIDRAPTLSTADAIGLGGQNRVRSFEHPHTQANYLTEEMGFRVARKHSHRLRHLSLLAGFLAPFLLAMLGLLQPAIGAFAAWLALLCGVSGVLLERWLFFAEARHMVMLYYGAR